MKETRIRQLEALTARESERRAKDVKEGETSRSMRDSSMLRSRLKKVPKKYSFWVDVKLAQEG